MRLLGIRFEKQMFYGHGLDMVHTWKGNGTSICSNLEKTLAGSPSQETHLIIAKTFLELMSERVLSIYIYTHIYIHIYIYIYIIYIYYIIYYNISSGIS